MHEHFVKWGRFYLTLELLWTLAWFGLEVWFNVNDNAREFEQALFDTILRLVGVIAIVRTIKALSQKSHHHHHTSWFDVFVIWVIGFIMARQTMVLFRSPFYANAGSPFWQGLAGMILSGLAITFLELIWISGAYHYMTHEHPRGLFYQLYKFFGYGGSITVEYQPLHHEKTHEYDILDVDQKIRSTPASNISVRGLKK